MDASTVCRFMRPDPPTAHEDESLQNVIEMIVKEKIDGIPIVDKNRCVRGLITRAHVLRLIAQNIDLKAPAREIMKRDIITISPDTEVQKLITWNVSSLPVIDQDKLVGIVTLDQVQYYV